MENIDIEFEKDYDEENIASADHYYSKTKSSVKGKYTNSSIVARLLGFDSDLDTVQECNIQEVDESLEFSIPLLTKSLSCPGFGNNDVHNISAYENICNSSLTEINKKWDEEICKGEAASGASPNKVRFGEVKVYPMISWSFAYRNARRGPWEQFARDRFRFSDRVLKLEHIISPVLSDNHRKTMYRKLYA